MFAVVLCGWRSCPFLGCCLFSGLLLFACGGVCCSCLVCLLTGVCKCCLSCLLLFGVHCWCSVLSMFVLVGLLCLLCRCFFSVICGCRLPLVCSFGVFLVAVCRLRVLFFVGVVFNVVVCCFCCWLVLLFGIGALFMSLIVVVVSCRCVFMCLSFVECRNLLFFVDCCVMCVDVVCVCLFVVGCLLLIVELV